MQQLFVRSSQSGVVARLPKSGEIGLDAGREVAGVTGKPDATGGSKRGRPRRANIFRGAITDSFLAAALRERFALTRMESVVACALADGLTYEEIADRFEISYHTVHSHVKAIHQKAGVSSNAKILALIRKAGWR